MTNKTRVNHIPHVKVEGSISAPRFFDSQAYETMSELAAAIDTDPGTIYLSDDVVLDAEFTVAENQRLLLAKGVTITLGDFDLIIEGEFQELADQQLFVLNGAGIVQFVNPPREIFISWWGDDDAAFDHAFDAITIGTLIHTGHHQLSSDLTIPSDITLEFRKDGMLSGYVLPRTLTVHGKIVAENKKIFGVGLTILGLQDANPRWWGAEGDGTTDDTEFFEDALDSLTAASGFLNITSGTYLIENGADWSGYDHVYFNFFHNSKLSIPVDQEVLLLRRWLVRPFGIEDFWEGDGILLFIESFSFDTMSFLTSGTIHPATEEVSILGFYEVGDGGGGTFYWDEFEDKANHNGGTIIDPDRTATPGTQDWYDPALNNVGDGCWISMSLHDFDIRQFGMVSGDDVNNGETNRNGWFGAINSLKPYSKITIRGYYHFGYKLHGPLGRAVTWQDDLYIDGYGGSIVYDHSTTEANATSLIRFGYNNTGEFDASNNVTVVGLELKNVAEIPHPEMSASSFLNFYSPSKNITLRDIYISRIGWYGVSVRAGSNGLAENFYMENVHMVECGIGSDSGMAQYPLALVRQGDYSHHSPNYCTKNLVMINCTVDGSAWHANTINSMPTKLHDIDGGYFENVFFKGYDEGGGSSGMNIDGSKNLHFYKCDFALGQPFEIFGCYEVDDDGNYVADIEDHNITFDQCVFRNRTRGRLDGGTGGASLNGVRFYNCYVSGRIYTAHTPSGGNTYKNWEMHNCLIEMSISTFIQHGEGHRITNTVLRNINDDRTNDYLHRLYLFFTDSIFENVTIEGYDVEDSLNRLYLHHPSGEVGISNNTFYSCRFLNMVIESCNQENSIFQGCVFDVGLCTRMLNIALQDQTKFLNCHFKMNKNSYGVALTTLGATSYFIDNLIELPDDEAFNRVLTISNLHTLIFTNNTIIQEQPQANSYHFYFPADNLTATSRVQDNILDFNGGDTYATSSDLEDAAAAINTTGKSAGDAVYCTNHRRWVYASGGNASDNWNYAGGATAYSPS